MKSICTKIAAACLLLIAQHSYAQSVTISTTNPAPTPGFKTADSVSATIGFTSTNTGTFHDFAKGKADTIVSPQYYYTMPQSVIYFDYNITVANPGSTTTPKILIVTSNGDTVMATASQLTFTGTSIDYYFTFTLATALPANTNFKIIMTMVAGNKAVTANTLSTNAIRGTAPANGPLPLPVKFISFNGKAVNGGISLTWNVGTELNLSGYEVQRSTNGSSFTKIGFVAANNQPSYSFADSKATDVVYYRIKSIDLDGTYAYSTVISIKGQQSSVVLKAFPMPVQNQLTVQHPSANVNSKIEIITADGRLMKSVSIDKDAQQTTVDLSTAKAGVYIVRFVNGTDVETSKIIKQ